MPGRDPAAEAARSAVRARLNAAGHAVANARDAMAELEQAFSSGVLARTPALDLMLADLRAALDQGAGAPLGGKSADAARRILGAIGRELDRS